MLLVGSTKGLWDLDSGTELVAGAAVTWLAPAGRSWHALLDGQRLVRSGAGGVEDVGRLDAADGKSMAVLAEETVFVGRADARLAVLGAVPRGVAEFDGVPGRDAWENPAAATPDVRSMAVADGRLWVNVHVGGLWSTDDAGRTWAQAIEPGADIHEVRAVPGGTVTVAAAVGFGWSEDGGRTWSWTTAGLHAHYLRATAVDGRQVAVSASDGPFTRRGGVYVGALGQGFVRCRAGLPEWFPDNVDSAALDLAGGRVAFGIGDDVYVSDDAGESWERAAAGLGRVTAVRFALA